MFVRHNSHKMDNNNTKWVLGHKVKPYESTVDYDLAIGETPPKVQGPPPHIHRKLKEVFLVIEGEMDFIINGTVRAIRAGQSVDIPTETLHTFANNSETPCKWVNIHSPKGFRSFFEAVGISADIANASQKSLSPQIINEVMQTAENYDMLIKID